MKPFNRYFFIIPLLLLVNLFLPNAALAKIIDEPGEKTNGGGQIIPPSDRGIINPALKGDLGSGDPGDIFGRFIGSWWGTAYAIGGLMFMLYLIWGGVEWIMGGSNEERVTNAKNKITNALIGLALLTVSFALIKAIGFILGIGILENLSQGLDVLAP